MKRFLFNFISELLIYMRLQTSTNEVLMPAVYVVVTHCDTVMKVKQG